MNISNNILCKNDINIINSILNNTIIITFLDKNYIDIFNIFYSYFQKLNLNNLLVISLDDFTYNYLINKNIKTIKKEYNIVSKDKFWSFRLNIINDIFKSSKKNLIHTDSDCFWFKNIIEEISKIENDYDIIGHVAFIYPKDISAKYGIVLCCGFYYLKYNEKNMDIIDRIREQNSDLLDDQVLFNYYIFNNHKTIYDNDIDNIIWKNIILKDATKVGIIKNDIISRTYQENLYCFHPLLLPKKTEDKIIELKKYISI